MVGWTPDACPRAASIARHGRPSIVWQSPQVFASAPNWWAASSMVAAVDNCAAATLIASRLIFQAGSIGPPTARDARAVASQKASRRGRLYSIRGSDSPVTGAAIRVNVAGGVRDRLSPARRARRRLAPARKPRRRDPRAPAAARRAQARQAPAAASPDRPRLLGRRLSRLVAMGRRARDREAGDRDRVAAPGLRSLLGLEVEARRTTAARAGGRCGYRANGSREPALEPSPDRERTRQAWPRRQQGHRRQGHAEATWRSPSAAVHDLGEVPANASRLHHRDPLPRGADCDVQPAVRLLCPLAGEAAHPACQRDGAPVCRVGRSADRRGGRPRYPRGPSDSRPRRNLRRGLQRASAKPWYRTAPHLAEIPLAERLRGTVGRHSSSRAARSRGCARGASSPVLGPPARRLLQRGPPAPRDPPADS